MVFLLWAVLYNNYNVKKHDQSMAIYTNQLCTHVCVFQNVGIGTVLSMMKSPCGLLGALGLSRLGAGTVKELSQVKGCQ